VANKYQGPGPPGLSLEIRGDGSPIPQSFACRLPSIFILLSKKPAARAIALI
jgi:hypothetical protein